MTQENEPNEKELWNLINETEGADRADTLLSLSYIANSKGDHKECLALCETAREIYEGLGAEASNATLAHIYNGISWSLKFLDRPAEAAAAADKASMLYREIGSVEMICTLRNEASFWYDAKDYEKALEYYRKALAEPNPDDNEFHTGRDYYNIGTSLLKLDNWQEALDNFLIARNIFKKERDPLQVAFCDEEIAYCYNKLGNPTEGEHYGLKALDFAKTAQDDEREFWACMRLGISYLKQEQWDKAMNYIRTSQRIILQCDSPNWKHVIYIEEKIAEILTAQGNTEEADEITRRIATIKETMDCAQEESTDSLDNPVPTLE